MKVVWLSFCLSIWLVSAGVNIDVACEYRGAEFEFKIHADKTGNIDHWGTNIQLHENEYHTWDLNITNLVIFVKTQSKYKVLSVCFDVQVFNSKDNNGMQDSRSFVNIYAVKNGRNNLIHSFKFRLYEPLNDLQAGSDFIVYGPEHDDFVIYNIWKSDDEEFEVYTVKIVNPDGEVLLEHEEVLKVDRSVLLKKIYNLIDHRAYLSDKNILIKTSQVKRNKKYKDVQLVFKTILERYVIKGTGAVLNANFISEYSAVDAIRQEFRKYREDDLLFYLLKRKPVYYKDENGKVDYSEEDYEAHNAYYPVNSRFFLDTKLPDELEIFYVVLFDKASILGSEIHSNKELVGWNPDKPAKDDELIDNYSRKVHQDFKLFMIQDDDRSVDVIYYFRAYTYFDDFPVKSDTYGQFFHGTVKEDKVVIRKYPFSKRIHRLMLQQGLKRQLDLEDLVTNNIFDRHIQKVEVSSCFDTYTGDVLHDGYINNGKEKYNVGSWASAELPDDHTVKVVLHNEQMVEKIRIYWAIDKGEYMGAKRLLVKAGEKKINTGSILYRSLNFLKDKNGKYIDLEINQNCKEIVITQPAGNGHPARPNIMWISEITINE